MLLTADACIPKVLAVYQKKSSLIYKYTTSNDQYVPPIIVNSLMRLLDFSCMQEYNRIYKDMYFAEKTIWYKQLLSRLHVKGEGLFENT